MVSKNTYHCFNMKRSTRKNTKNASFVNKFNDRFIVLFLLVLVYVCLFLLIPTLFSHKQFSDYKTLTPTPAISNYLTHKLLRHIRHYLFSGNKNISSVYIPPIPIVQTVGWDFFCNNISFNSSIK